MGLFWDGARQKATKSRFSSFVEIGAWRERLGPANRYQFLRANYICGGPILEANGRAKGGKLAEFGACFGVFRWWQNLRQKLSVSVMLSKVLGQGMVRDWCCC